MSLNDYGFHLANLGAFKHFVFDDWHVRVDIMATTIFISWSGEKSRRAAEVFRSWIPSVLQSVTPYFTPSDIEKGSRWSGEISQKLEECDVGLLCVTSENVNKPWLLFEAGALSKSLSRSKVCPILLDLDESEVQGPLVQFQFSRFNKDEMFSLLQSINSSSGELALDDALFDSVFTKWWPDLDASIGDVLRQPAEVENIKKVRSDREVLNEILGVVREIRKNPVNFTDRSENLTEERWLTLKSLTDHGHLINYLEESQKDPTNFDRTMHYIKKLRSSYESLYNNFLRDLNLSGGKKYCYECGSSNIELYNDAFRCLACGASRRV